MLIALALLLAALILVLIKDYDFWFPPTSSTIRIGACRTARPEVKTPSETVTTVTPPPVVHPRPKAKARTQPEGCRPQSCAGFGASRHEPRGAASARSRSRGRRRTPNHPGNQQLRQGGLTSQSTIFASAAAFFAQCLCQHDSRLYRYSGRYRESSYLSRLGRTTVSPSRTELPYAGQADQGTGRGRAGSSHRTRRQYSGPARL